MSGFARLCTIAATLALFAGPALAGDTMSGPKADTIKQSSDQSDSDFRGDCDAQKGTVSGRSGHLVCTLPPSDMMSAPKH